MSLVLALKGNTNHHPAGSPKGGQFAPSKGVSTSPAVNGEHEKIINGKTDALKSKAVHLNDIEAAFGYYVGAGYHHVNHILRNGTLKPDRTLYGDDMELATDAVATMDFLLDSSEPISEGRSFYRGMSLVDDDAEPFLNEGNLVTDRGFVSTSTLETVARSFTTSYYNDGSHPEDAPIKIVNLIEAVVVVPSGVKVLDVTHPPLGVSSRPFEKEVILPRGAVYKVTKVSKRQRTQEEINLYTDRYKIELEMVSGDSVEKSSRTAIEVEMSEPFTGYNGPAQREMLADKPLALALKINSKHHPAGSSKGGQFAPKLSDVTAVLSKDEQTINKYASLLKDKLAGTGVEVRDVSELKAAILSYANNGYRPINRTLRSGVPGQLVGGINSNEHAKQHIAAMDVAMGMIAPIAKPMSFYRGISAPVELSEAFLTVGNKVADRAFVSTSTDKSITDRFAGKVIPDHEGKEHLGISAVINVPKGFKAMNVTGTVGQHSGSYEMEYLLPRGTVFEVKKVTKTNGPPVVNGSKFSYYKVELDVVRSPIMGSAKTTKADGDVHIVEMTEPFTGYREPSDAPRFTEAEKKNDQKLELRLALKFTDAHGRSRVPAGSAKGGQFAPKGSQSGMNNKVGFTKYIKLREVKRMADKDAVWFNKNQSYEQKNNLSKMKVGDLAESIVASVMHSQGLRADKPSNKTNDPFDLIHGNILAEVKGGQVNNSEGAQQWRVTTGGMSKKEKAKYEKMGPEDRARFNKWRKVLAMRRKRNMVQEVAERTGKEVRQYFVGVLVDHDKRKADIFIYKGAHKRVSWKQADEHHYLGTYAYGE